MPRPWGSTKAAVEAILGDLGPLTRAELCRELGLSRELVSAVLSRLHRAGGAHIVGYVLDDEVGRQYPRARYALGAGRDAAKPALDKAGVRLRSQRRTRTRIQTSSVFNLAMTRAQCIERRRMAMGGADGHDQ